jgi:hypothetical protein
MTTKKPLYKVPAPSTSFTNTAFIQDCNGTRIRFDYVRDGVEHSGGISFSGVVVSRHTAERACQEWHIEGAYDTLAEVENSPWVEEMRAQIVERWRYHWQMHHYMIYLDGGCFEFIADSWAALPEEICDK